MLEVLQLLQILTVSTRDVWYSGLSSFCLGLHLLGERKHKMCWYLCQGWGPILQLPQKECRGNEIFWAQNCDSSHLINFSPTNAFSPPLLCQTTRRNPSPTIKSPSIPFLKGRKFGQMKESRTVLYQRSICASKKSCSQWLRTSSRPSWPTSVPQKHSDTSFLLCFVLLIKIWGLALFYKTVPFCSYHSEN